jgi:hypothetical protein
MPWKIEYISNESSAKESGINAELEQIQMSSGSGNDKDCRI